MTADNEDSLLFFNPLEICLEVSNNYFLDIMSS